MTDQDIQTKNADVFDATESSNYLYGFPFDHYSVLDHTSSQEAWYREASNENPSETILVQVAGASGSDRTIYEIIPSGFDFLVGSRFKEQKLKLPAGIILFSNPEYAGGASIPNSSRQIDQTMPAVIIFQDSTNQQHTLNLNDYITGGEYISWASILRDIGAADRFKLIYSDEHQRRRKSEISKKPLLGWAELDLISIMDFKTGIMPGLQYIPHQGDRVLSIINVKKEYDKIKNFITRETSQDAGAIDNFAADSKMHAEMLGKIFRGLTGTRNGTLYRDIHNLAKEFKERIDIEIDATPALGSNSDIQAALSRLDFKIPKVHFCEESRHTLTLENLEMKANVDPEVISYLKQVGHFGVLEVAAPTKSCAPCRPDAPFSSPKAQHRPSESLLA